MIIPENVKGLSADRALAQKLIPVSRETAARLDHLVNLLLQWQKTRNLISDSTLPKIWTRHIADSLQLLPLAPQAKIWVDLGSGGGFPGLVLACALAETPGSKVHLVESSTKKSAFLQAVIQAEALPAEVHCQRIEDFIPAFPDRPDAVTARALAPLPKLLTLAYPLLKKGAVGLFLKGQDVEGELTEAAKYWSIQHNLAPSRTDARGRVVIVTGLESRNKNQAKTALSNRTKRKSP